MAEKTVTVRNRILGGGEPKICIPVTARNFDELEEQTANLLQVPCDMVEWRADYFDAGIPDWICTCLKLLRQKIGERPLLFTYRTVSEGGKGREEEKTYEKLNLEAAASGLADLVDLEWNRGETLFCRAAEEIHKKNALVVGSFHDFEKTPPEEEIVRILCRIQTLGADISKAAVMPQCEQDVLTLLSASLAMKKRYADRPYITMSMGGLGAFTRLCGSFTGSAVTFATAGPASAPGQMDARAVAAVRDEVRKGAEA